MFREFISKLAQVERLDRVVNTQDLQFGAVDGPAGQPRLAMRLPSSEVVTLEDNAQAQLAGQWGVPAAHLARLPVELATAELTHFASVAPRDITVRATREADKEHLVARAVLSGRYEPFDSQAVLQVIEPHVAGFEISSAIVERDEMRLALTLPGHAYDVSARRVGDITKAALVVSNSETGSMSLRAELSLFRLVCSNGMIAADMVSTRVRHIHVDRSEFIAKLRDTVSNAGRVGEQVARRLQATHALVLPDLNPDNGKLQREVLGILRRSNVWSETFAKEAEQALAQGERTLFELIQHVTDNARLSTMRLADRVHRERVAGRLMALAA